MLIGLDFDNTLAGYDRAFTVTAREMVGAPDTLTSKAGVRAWARAQGADGETLWQRVQGRVYGARMSEATLIPGVADFLLRCRAAKVPVVIVSHKTRHGHFDPDRIDLREAARGWMVAQGFFDPDRFGLDPDAVWFEGERGLKIARIASLGCTHFVDDLEEVLGDPTFPAHVQRWLYAPGDAPAPVGPFTVRCHWREISDDILPSLD